MDEKDKKINDLCRRLKKCVSVAEKFKKRLTVQEEVRKFSYIKVSLRQIYDFMLSFCLKIKILNVYS